MLANMDRAVVQPLLVIDQDSDYQSIAESFLTRCGYRVEQTSDHQHGLSLALKRSYEAVIIGAGGAQAQTIELLRKLKTGTDSEVIVLAEAATVRTAVEAMRSGAYDYFAAPIALEELEATLAKACRATRLRRDKARRRTATSALGRRKMIGQSPAMKEIERLIDRAGPTDKPILIQGESGTGKELVARALHQVSGRADKPMVVINCAALPAMLLESELFGHEKGAYTGATTARQGLFEAADGGTMFIDEIGEMDAALQAKLLRVLEDGSLRRVGALTERRVDVRLVTATNRDLALEVREGRFREDLYYRINVMRLQLAPLRDRPGDVALLVQSFLGSGWSIEADALLALQRYHWPGNIRQLINAIERAKILADNQQIQLTDLPTEIASSTQPRMVSCEEQEFNLESLKRSQIELVLARENGNKVRAARVLGVSRRSLYRLLSKYEIAMG